LRIVRALRHRVDREIATPEVFLEGHVWRELRFETAIARSHLSLEPGECVFVDDLRENCEGAEAVGMTAVLHRGADASLERLEELLGISLR